LAPVAGVVLVALAIYNFSRTYQSRPIHLRFSGTNASSAVSELASKVLREVRTHGIELERVITSTSREIARAVDLGLLEVGIIRGGFPPHEFQNLRQVAALGVEPLHLVVRGDVAGEGPPGLDVLKGRRVYVGERGSNSAALAEDLLQFAGFEAGDGTTTADYEAYYASEQQLRQEVDQIAHLPPSERAPRLAKLPEALFVGGALPDALIDGLVRMGCYRLVPLPYKQALHIDEHRYHGTQQRPLDNRRIESATIPAYTYGAMPAMPVRDFETIGLRLLLVAHQDVPSAAVEKLLRALDEGTFHQYHAELSVGESLAEYPLHSGANAYLASRRPISLNDAVQNTTNALSMIGAFTAGAFALWSYFRGLRSVSPQYYLQQIDRIERVVRGVESEDTAPTAPVELLVYLEARLAELKQTVVDDYAQGRLMDDDALVGILTLIADTRNLLVQTNLRLSQTPVERGTILHRDAA
jgi:TRAP-type uncharacterized transport system substrate-binding protein